VLLGLTDSMLGVAWPAIRQTFGEPLSALGLLLVATAIGYVATAVPNGQLLNRFGAARTLVTASLAASVACTLLALAPTVWVLVAAALLLGAASGAVDAGLNTVVANDGPLRLLNAIHGAYGVGTVLGPILVTVAIVSAGSWRVPYGILIGAEALCALGWWTVRPFTDAGRPAGQAGRFAGQAGWPAGQADRPARRAAPAPPRLEAGVAVAVGVALVYAGAEFGVGQWAASYLRGVASLRPAGAGFAVAGYWGVFATARLVLALPGRQAAAELMMRAGCVVALAGAGLLWLGRGPAISVAAFIVIGAGLAPVFPALLSLTAVRFGAARAQHVIGWQLAAAGAGGQCISALTGLLLGRLGLLALGPVLTVLVLLTLAASALLSKLSPLA